MSDKEKAFERLRTNEALEEDLAIANTKIDRLCGALLEAAKELEDFENIYAPHEHNDCIDEYRAIVKEIKDNK